MARKHDNRFIPAWAGNMRKCFQGSMALAVHPRVGGEHKNADIPRWGVFGSSPRGRGTFRRRKLHACRIRFIPAWAGNMNISRARSALTPVHPRVGGEHSDDPCLSAPMNGSSPRGRGTCPHGGHARRRRRFIPAWAGNIKAAKGSGTSTPVHPRVGGEHAPSREESHASIGSSPRGRGTFNTFYPSRSNIRFIPAWAGNIFCFLGDSSRSTVHPRVGGEHV